MPVYALRTAGSLRLFNVLLFFSCVVVGILYSHLILGTNSVFQSGV